jgi:succinoglycan biosynthesis protein ExoM
MTIRYSVCICTYRRPGVSNTVHSLFAQEGVTLADVEIIVADDDPACSARQSLRRLAHAAPVTLRYVESAAKNISTCRNVCLTAAKADWIAFIDDDQTAEPGWLREMIATAEESKADAVKCYVRGMYPPGTPRWIRVGGAFTYDYGPSGTEVRFAATCGILFRRILPAGGELLFKTALGVMGGEDADFFIRYKAMGGKIVSCRSAIVNEVVPTERANSAYLRRRCRRHGHIQARIVIERRSSIGRALSIAKSVVGVATTALYSAVRIVHPAMSCRMFMKFWYHFGVLEWSVGRKALCHE